MGVTAHTSVSEFFHHVLTEAIQRNGFCASKPTETYLVGLLSEFAKNQITDQPLSMLLVGDHSPNERIRVLKEVGDTSLYITGFFADSLQQQKWVDAGYYIGLGTSAYKQLAVQLYHSKSIRIVYEELATKFPGFVEVLGEVRSQVNVASGDLVSMYQQWQETRSEWIEQRLRSLGVLVSASDEGDGYVH